MSVEENKALVQRYIDGYNRHDVDGLAALFSVDTLNHQQRDGREGVRLIVQRLFVCFPDQHFEVEELVAEGDAVSCLTTMTGTHLGTPDPPGPYSGLVGIPPTGKRVAVLQSHHFRIKDGEIIAHRATRDDLGMFRQLGLMQ